jgi:hypothetical protein
MSVENQARRPRSVVQADRPALAQVGPPGDFLAIRETGPEIDLLAFEQADPQLVRLACGDRINDRPKIVFDRVTARSEVFWIVSTS